MSNWPVQLRIVGATEADEDTSIQLNAFIDFDDGSFRDVTLEVQWETVSPYANISTTGLLVFGSITGNQTVNVSASYNHDEAGFLTAVHSVFVYDTNIPQVLYSIAIEGPSEVVKNTTANYIVRATYTNGRTEIVTPTSFMSDRPSVATIGVDGHAIFNNIRGSLDVTFTAIYMLNGVSRSTQIVVAIEDNSIYPADAKLTGPEVISSVCTNNYKFVVAYEDGSKQQVYPVWHVSGDATIDCKGNLTPNQILGVGQATIVASFTHEGVTVADIINLTIYGVDITPRGLTIEGPESIREGLTGIYKTVIHFSDGSSTPVAAEIQSESEYLHIESNVVQAFPVIADEDAVLQATYNGHTATKDIKILKQESQVVDLKIECADDVNSGRSIVVKTKAYFDDGSSSYVRAHLTATHPGSYFVNDEFHVPVVEDNIHVRITATYHLHGEFTAEHVILLRRRTPKVTSLSIECPDVFKSTDHVLVFAYFDDGTKVPVDVPVFADGQPITVGYAPTDYAILTAEYRGIAAFKEVIS